MIRKLLASTAMLALMTAGSFSIAQAQDEPAQTQEPAVIEHDATQDGAATDSTAEVTDEEKLTPAEPTVATAFMGRAVFSSEDPESDNIGEVNDLIIDQDGAITHAVVGVGGFLGIGEKDVAVPFDELQVVEREGEIRLVYAATKEQLEAAEEFDRTAYDPGERFAEEQAAMQPDPAADATAPAAGTDTMLAPAEPEIAATEEPAADADATAEQDVAVETEAPAAETDMTAEQDVAAETEAPAAETDMTAEQDVAADAEATAETDVTADAGTGITAGEAGFLDYDVNAVRASAMLGQEVYGAEDESIGEVSDLVLQEDGGTRAAIVDVGGFLGVGEKSVAIPFDQIEVQPQEGGEARLAVAMTREELEAAPAFEGLASEQDLAATEAPADATDPAADATAPDLTADATLPDATAPADATAEGDMVAEGGTDVSGYELATQDLSADELMGSAVYGSNDENIGEVGDVIFTTTGDIQAVVIDVGGFLGMGEKPVAVQFDALNVQKDTNGAVQLMINANQEQLEGAPAYQDETAAVQ